MIFLCRRPRRNNGNGDDEDQGQLIAKGADNDQDVANCIADANDANIQVAEVVQLVDDSLIKIENEAIMEDSNQIVPIPRPVNNIQHMADNEINAKSSVKADGGNMFEAAKIRNAIEAVGRQIDDKNKAEQKSVRIILL